MERGALNKLRKMVVQIEKNNLNKKMHPNTEKFLNSIKSKIKMAEQDPCFGGKYKK